MESRGLLVLLLLIASVESQKLVWCHYMMGLTYDATQASINTDVRMAVDTGFDGFALNIGPEDWQFDRTRLVFNAAANYPNFKLFFSFDMHFLPKGDFGKLVSYLETYGPSPSHYRYQNKIFVTTFAGEDVTFGTGNLNQGWTNFKNAMAGKNLPIFFVPSWTALGPNNIYANNPVLDGHYTWHAWPAIGVESLSIDLDNQWKAQAVSNNKLWMPAVSPWFFTHFLEYKKNWWFNSETLFVERWNQIFQLDPPMIEFITWNDFGESHYIGPIAGSPPQESLNWITGFDHTAWLDLTKIYITRYKTGQWPSSATDKVWYWYRPHSKNAQRSDSQGKPQGWETADDVIVIVTYLNSPGVVTVNNAGTVTNVNAATGLQMNTVGPFQPGSVTVSLSRNGNQVGSSNGRAIEQPGAGSQYNFNAYVNQFSVAAGQNPTCNGAPAGAGTGLSADYFSDVALTTKFQTRVDRTVDFNWAAGAPIAGMPTDNFSVRWSGKIQAKFSGRHTFTVNSDDGVRLFIAGVSVIDQWRGQAATDSAGTAVLTAGIQTDVILEYFDSAFDALVHFYWEMPGCLSREIVPTSALFPASVTGNPGGNTCVQTPAAAGTGTGLSGQYFSDLNFGTSALTRVDPTINFNWVSGSPGAGVPVDGFTVRWSGQVQPLFTDSYTFFTTNDDGVRLWVDNKLLIDNWLGHGAAEFFGAVQLMTGVKYDIKLEYFDSGGFASVNLSWSSLCQPKVIIPASQLYPAANSGGQTCGSVGSGNGLSGSYYSGSNFNTLVYSRVDPGVDFDWAYGAPAIGVTPDDFTVRWSGQIQAKFTGVTTFYVASDDGNRLWINDVMIINDWNYHAAKENAVVETSGTSRTVNGAYYAIRLDFLEGGYTASVKLYWSASGCFDKEIIPASYLYSSKVKPLMNTMESGDTRIPFEDGGDIGAFQLSSGSLYYVSFVLIAILLQ